MNRLLKDKGLIAILDIPDNIGCRFFRNSWNIATKDELVVKLVSIIDEARKENLQLISKLDSRFNEKEQVAKKDSPGPLKWF